MPYSAEDKKQIFEKIINLIEDGHSLRKACENAKLSRKTFLSWIDNDSELSNQYTRACDERADLIFESIKDDFSETPQRDPESGRIDTGWVQLQRLKIDSKKWQLGKMKPKKYGDKIETEHSGEITINFQE